MSSTPSLPTLPTRVAELLTGLVPNRPEVFDELRSLYASDLTFRDPIQVVHGIGDFVSMNERLLSRMSTLEWTIRGAWGDDEAATIEWTMRGKPKLGPTVEVEGMSRVRARDGKVVDHRDYWDLSELSASAIPGGENVRRLLLRPFA